MLVCVGCPAPQHAVAPRRAVDKQALFGDAGLVPTREGERVRRELALAGELHAALEQLGLTGVHVDVELNDPPGVIVIARADLEADIASLESTIIGFARVIVPDASTVHVEIRRLESGGERPAPSDDDRLPWTIALVCLGLGLSLGVTVERLLARRR
jgi:hypothetical protein